MGKRLTSRRVVSNPSQNRDSLLIIITTITTEESIRMIGRRDAKKIKNRGSETIEVEVDMDTEMDVGEETIEEEEEVEVIEVEVGAEEVDETSGKEILSKL